MVEIDSSTGISRSDPDSWFFAGLTSSFPDIAASESSTPARGNQKIRLSDSIPCTRNKTTEETAQSPSSTACKIFRVPEHTHSTSTSASDIVELAPDDALISVGLEEQVMIFKHRGKFHAVDHQCPHRAYPLSKGSIYDIEDFGIVLSAGVMCPKHGWAFDLHTGESDRGAYKLRVWDLEVRESRNWRQSEGESGRDGSKEVWVKRR